MAVFEMVEYDATGPGDPDGMVYLRNPYEGQIRGNDVLIGDAVDEAGVPLHGEHSSQYLVPASAVTSRTPLRLDPSRGLVVVAGSRG